MNITFKVGSTPVLLLISVIKEPVTDTVGLILLLSFSLSAKSSLIFYFKEHGHTNCGWRRSRPSIVLYLINLITID